MVLFADELIFGNAEDRITVIDDNSLAVSDPLDLPGLVADAL